MLKSVHAKHKGQRNNDDSGRLLADVDIGKVDGQFLHDSWWQWSPILDADPTAVWTGSGLG